MLRNPKARMGVLALVLLPHSGLAQEVDLRAGVRAAATGEVQAQGLVGLAVGVVLDGEVAFTEYFGWEDREAEVPVTAETRFRWASISKPVTAVVALQLARAGKLDLDADVREYVPEFPAKEHPITARQLLGHLGGVVHYTNGEVVRTERTYDVEHPYADVVLALDRFKQSPLVAVPGTKYAYTTHGYILLSAVVQRAGGASYWDQVRARVCAPAHLASLRPDYQWEQIPHRATGYKRPQREVLRSTNTDVSWKLGGGGYVSTIGDLAGFAAALLGDDLLTDEDKALAWTSQEAGGKRTGYGLGFGTRVVDGERVVEHSGSQEKTRTWMRLLPEHGLAVVVMTNSEWAQLRGLVTELVGVVR
jgi:serine beta-lactamase-like protein LACTB